MAFKRFQSFSRKKSLEPCFIGFNCSAFNHRPIPPRLFYWEKTEWSLARATPCARASHFCSIWRSSLKSHWQAPIIIIVIIIIIIFLTLKQWRAINAHFNKNRITFLREKMKKVFRTNDWRTSRAEKIIFRIVNDTQSVWRPPLKGHYNFIHFRHNTS